MKVSKMARDPLKTAHAVPVFTDTFTAWIGQFKAEIIRTRNIKHKGTKGMLRESPLADFFSKKLPSVFGVTTGEAVDLDNRSSPQLDVLFYNRMRDFPFVSESAVVLPAEALLASIEVKSRLDANEARKSVEAARTLRKLRPFKAELGGRDIKDTSSSAALSKPALDA
jgi:hypothetical protein